jgi:hypothetical protein
LDEFRGFMALTGVSFVCSPWVGFIWAIKYAKLIFNPSITLISRFRLHRRSDNTRFFVQYAAFFYPVLQTVFTDQYRNLLDKYSAFWKSLCT